MDTSGLLNVVGSSANLISPMHLVTNALGGLQPAVVALQGADSFIISNAITETNIIVQAVFSSVGDPAISTQVRFSPNPVTNNIFTATIQYSAALPNVCTGSDDLYSIYLRDTLAWDTNTVFEANAVNGTFKPSTYTASWSPPSDWFAGAPGSGELSPELLYNTTFSNTLVTNFF